MPLVLIIDDNPTVVMALEVLLSLHDMQTVSAATPQEGLAQLQAHTVDLVIQDMNFSADTTSGAEGVDLFHRIRDAWPDMPVILLTAWTHLEAAVGLIKAGAADYLAKPWDDERLMVTVRNLIELGQAGRSLRQRLARDLQDKQALEQRYDLCGLIWQDAAMARLLQMACQVATSDVPVLITGPNGAGKEKIAQIIQRNSSVPDGPFVVLNCGAIPAELIEAELFGAEAGSYTGAAKAREGKFEAADGGTLFLDEIGNLPLSGQMKLLRVLETGGFQRLGSNRERRVKVRILSATNADLPAMIRAGQFREDLYYRLNVIPLSVPALSERPDDILPLAQAFLGANRQLKPDAVQALEQYGWPGNVRELKNLMQRVQLLCPHTVLGKEDLQLPVSTARMKDTEAGPDKASIEAALVQAGGVVAQAAAALGLSRQSLYRRMERFGIERHSG